MVTKLEANMTKSEVCNIFLVKFEEVIGQESSDTEIIT